MNRRPLLKRLSQGALGNVAFNDMISLVEGFGFRQSRVTGSHHIFAHPAIQELAHFQEVKGEAKPYQIRQFLGLIERDNLKLVDEK